MRKAALLSPKVKMLAWLSACFLIILLPGEAQQTDKPDDFPTRFHISIRSKPGRTVGTIDFRRISY